MFHGTYHNIRFRAKLRKFVALRRHYGIDGWKRINEWRKIAETHHRLRLRFVICAKAAGRANHFERTESC
jgi:hypothetical protein